MLPELKCQDHLEDLIVVNIKYDSQRKSRLFCDRCLEQNEHSNKFISIKNLPQLASDFIKQMIDNIEEELEVSDQIVSNFVKLLTTLRAETIKNIDNLIETAQKLNYEFMMQMSAEKVSFQNLAYILNNSKLEEITEYLSGSKRRQYQFPKIEKNIQHLVQMKSQFFDLFFKRQYFVGASTRTLMDQKIKKIIEKRERDIQQRQSVQQSSQSVLVDQPKPITANVIVQIGGKYFSLAVDPISTVKELIYTIDWRISFNIQSKRFIYLNSQRLRDEVKLGSLMQGNEVLRLEYRPDLQAVEN